MRQLVSILLDNAMRHSTGGEVSLTLSRDRGHARLTVVNEGEAIPEEQRERLFERFYRVDTARNGESKHYGLGLAIASQSCSPIRERSRSDAATGWLSLP